MTIDAIIAEGLKLDAERTLRVRTALIRIAENVAKHIVNRGGWDSSDSCFQIDLSESEKELNELSDNNFRALAEAYQEKCREVKAKDDALRDLCEKLKEQNK